MEKLADRFIPLSIWNSNILFVPRDADKKKAFKDALSLDDEMDTLICREDGKTGNKYGNCANVARTSSTVTRSLCMQTINVLCDRLTMMTRSACRSAAVQSTSSTRKKFRDSAFYSPSNIRPIQKIYKLAPEQKQEAAVIPGYELKTKPAGKVPDA